MDTGFILLALGVGAVVAVTFHFGRGRQPGTGSVNPAPPTQMQNDDDIAAMARAGRKIEAIKRYRELHGVGLKVAKKAVEDMM